MKYLTDDYAIKATFVKENLQNAYRVWTAALILARESGVLAEDEIPELQLNKFQHEPIITILKSYFKTDFTDKRRVRDVVDAKHVACYILKKYTKLTLRDIQDYLSMGHHSTVIHAIEKIGNLLSTDSDIKQDVECLMGIIESQLYQQSQAEIKIRDIQSNGASQQQMHRVVEDDLIKIAS